LFLKWSSASTPAVEGGAAGDGGCSDGTVLHKGLRLKCCARPGQAAPHDGQRKGIVPARRGVFK